MGGKKRHEPMIRWIEPGPGKRHQNNMMSCAPRRDPTANAAIGNVMREKRQQQRKQMKKNWKVRMHC